MANKKKCRSNIGGQAVIEGVMMMGESSIATAVRDESGNIQVESKRTTPTKEKSVFRRIPFVRGVINFVMTMYTGVGILMRSSEVFIGEEEPSKFEKWCAGKLHINVMSFIMFFAVILGLAMSIGLFFIIPHFAIEGIKLLAPNLHQLWLNLIEGILRILIFVGYIALTSLMKEIKRVFMYHGAEHKTISCYEYGLDLTVENVQKQSTIHDRCGTTFMFLVMIVSVLLFTLTAAIEVNMWGKLGIKLALLPVVAGISYEILKFLARFDNAFVRVIKWPGLLLQKLTTKQPTDDMVEVAIKAFQTVYDMDKNMDIPEQKFDTKVLFKNTRKELQDILSNIGDGNADDEWICAEVLGVKRSELENITHIKRSNSLKILELAKERAGGKPLQQVLGCTDFYGYSIKVTDKVLCPRPETEYLVEACVEIIKKEKLNDILDLCTGSGAIAIAIKKLTDANVTAGDISEEALEVAAENIKTNNVEIQLIQSNLFNNINCKYDMIISNPPYIRTEDIKNLDTEVKDYEPLIALDGGEDGYDFYRAIIKEAKGYLNNGGYIALEAGIGEAQIIAEMLNEDFIDIVIKKDLENNDRIVIAKVGANV